MIYYQKGRQISYGEPIGILLLENYAPFIPGDVANATTYSFPVRFQPVKDLTVKRIFAHDLTLLDEMISASKSLVANGVRAITGNCGFMALFQKEITKEVGVPVMLSSLLQIPFMQMLMEADKSIGIVTANSKSLTPNVFEAIGINYDEKRLLIEGLETRPAFNSGINEESGIIDSAMVKTEVVEAALKLQKQDPNMGSILLECSVLPTYGKAVQEATGLPVFDFITMINYVHSAVVKHEYYGHM
jgi:Asp/Glu/hydantoin racemase